MDLFHEDKVTAGVLLPRPFDQIFTYEFDELPELGTWVEVPFGGSKLTGVVWSLEQPDDLNLDRLKKVERVFAAVPMPDDQRKVVDRIASETLMHKGEALRLCMPPRDALAPKSTQTNIFRVQAPSNLKFSAGQQKILDVLGDKTVERSQVLSRANVSPAVIAGLVKKGAVAREKTVPDLQPPSVDFQNEISLNAEQVLATQAIAEKLRDQSFQSFLLDGVTGSGKTHVYFDAIAKALGAGKQVLWLVPEIALTDQLRERFAAHFGAQPLVWHSEAGAGAKSKAWRIAATGAPCVVLGARSALHCNFQNLGLIIVDEEHEQAFKQSEMGTYHARDMAEHRARLSNAVFVMGSATPSLETEFRTRAGQIERLRLTQRFGRAAPPQIELIDLRRDSPEKGQWLAESMKQAVADTILRGEQAMLFLNRRGYAPLSLCSDCGHKMACHQCTAWMVEHRFLGELNCHLCGTSAQKPEKCPSCETEDSFIPCGPGIERLMEEAVRSFPGARIGVFSSDTLRSANETRAAFDAVKDGSLDLLIGTQVLAKGLDFPDLTYVGVVDGDLGLSNEDLRAGERTFQLIQQVTGRAGRGSRSGLAQIQTRAPESELMRSLAQNDRDSFFDLELARREAFNMPPFSRLAALTIAHENPEILDEVVHAISQAAPKADGVELWGPTQARIALVRGWHRKRFVVRVPMGKRPQSYMSAWLKDLKYPSKTRVNVDIDPLSFT